MLIDKTMISTYKKINSMIIQFNDAICELGTIFENEVP